MLQAVCSRPASSFQSEHPLSLLHLLSTQKTKHPPLQSVWESASGLHHSWRLRVICEEDEGCDNSSVFIERLQDSVKRRSATEIQSSSQREKHIWHKRKSTEALLNHHCSGKKQKRHQTGRLHKITVKFSGCEETCGSDVTLMMSQKRCFSTRIRVRDNDMLIRNY